MGKKSDPPPGPDYNRLLKITEKYAAENSALMNEYMDFFKTSYADQKELQDQINEIQLPAMKDEAELAQAQRDRYREMGIPFENEYLDKITNWDTEQRRDERAGQAQAGIQMAADAARESELRRLEGYGIDPSQTRSAALDSNLRLQQALSTAAAGNNERQAVEREGLALGSEAINIYKGMPAQAAAHLATASQAGQTSFGNQAAMGQMGQSAYGQLGNMNAQGFNMYNQGYNTANNIYGNQLRGYELQQQYGAANQWGQLAGAALGAASSSGGFGGLFGFGAEGGPVPHAAEGGIPANAQGTAAPGGAGRPDRPGAPQAPAAQPRPASQGIPADNQPTMLTPGEFVIPDDVARWEGEKNLQKIINKAREDRTRTEAERANNQRALGIPA